MVAVVGAGVVNVWRPVAAVALLRAWSIACSLCGAACACPDFGCGSCRCTLHHGRIRHVPVGLQSGLQSRIGGGIWGLFGVIYIIALFVAMR